MSHSPLATALESYKASLEDLQSPSDGTITPLLVFKVLTSRNRVEVAHTVPDQTITPEQLQQLIDLDHQLQQQAEKLSKVVDFAQLRSSIFPAETAWWWNLDQLNFPDPSNQFNWLWRSLSILTWTVNLGLLLNIAGRFLSSGPGVGGAAAISLPAILALLQAKLDFRLNAIFHYM